jgi:hypothetical protein
VAPEENQAGSIDSLFLPDLAANSRYVYTGRRLERQRRNLKISR